MAVGTNFPPPEDVAEVLKQSLDIAAHDLLIRRDQLMASFGRAPTVIEDETIAGKTSDLIRQIQTCAKHAEAMREDQKAPHLAAERAVDAYFHNNFTTKGDKSNTSPLDSMRAQLEKRLTTYQLKKADEERKRREEEARIQAEAAAKAKAEADAALEAATAPPSDVEALILGGSAPQTEVSVEQAQTAIATAEAAQKAAIEAQRSADNATMADLSRTRAEQGAVSSLRSEWTFNEVSLDRGGLDLEALREHLPLDGLHKAIRSFIKAGGRELRGVEIYERHYTVTR